MNNTEIAQVFEDIAGLLEMRDESQFIVRSYRQAARSFKELDTQLEQMVRDGMALR